MRKTKEYQHYEQYLLRGALKKNGCQRIRYVFTGINRETGIERPFFIELVLVNPGLSPSKPVIGIPQDELVSPSQSYVLVKAGSYGKHPQQYKKFYALKDFLRQKGQAAFKVGNCIFGTNALVGSVVVGQTDLSAQPELDCSAGSISWELRFEHKVGTAPLFKKNNTVWIANGVKTLFSGVVRMAGLEYSVAPKKSFGYADRYWGPDAVAPLFHVSSSNLVSMISGNPLLKSCFTIGGELNGQMKAFLMLEGEQLSVRKCWFLEKWTEVHACSKTPADADGEKLHWTVSIHKKNIVVDIDVFCPTSEMIFQGNDLFQRGRQEMHTASGGSGFGEIRIYKKVRKSLELLEDARIESALCEYGIQSKDALSE
ncbi:MAG: hypothetical protein K6G80_09960 [Treponema sp.]|nr:hypothetical protein [Treponema sp.]